MNERKQPVIFMVSYLATGAEVVTAKHSSGEPATRAVTTSESLAHQESPVLFHSEGRTCKDNAQYINNAEFTRTGKSYGLSSNHS